MTHQRFMFTNLINIASFNDNDQLWLHKLYIYNMFEVYCLYKKGGGQKTRIIYNMAISTGKVQKVEFLYIKLSCSLQNSQKS